MHARRICSTSSQRQRDCASGSRENFRDLGTNYTGGAIEAVVMANMQGLGEAASAPALLPVINHHLPPKYVYLNSSV